MSFFEDGDYTNPDGKRRLAWQVALSNAAMQHYDNQTCQRGVCRDGTLTVTSQSIDETEFTRGLDVFLTRCV